MSCQGFFGFCFDIYGPHGYLHSFPTRRSSDLRRGGPARRARRPGLADLRKSRQSAGPARRSEEHTSELQSHVNIVCRLLLEKKNHSNSNELTWNQAMAATRID